jgi:hypothetical protein
LDERPSRPAILISVANFRGRMAFVLSATFPRRVKHHHQFPSTLPMPPSKRPWQCQHCLQGPDALSVGTRHGHHRYHESLCQGLDDSGKPLGLPNACVIPTCGKTGIQTSKAWYEHYKTHGISLSSDQDLQWLRCKYQADLLPNPNMNSFFGSFYSKKSTLAAFTDLAALWNEYQINPPDTAGRELPRLLRQYCQFFQ